MGVTPAEPHTATPRRLPRWNEISSAFDLRIRPPGRARVLERCASVADVRAVARRRVPRMVFDFVDGAAGSETSLDRARDLFHRVELEPRAMRDVSTVDLSVDLLGERSQLPFFFGPTGATRLMHEAGETAVARVAGQFGIPYTLSTLGTTSAEELARDAGATRRWFQLYLMSDRTRVRDILQRAADSGFDTLVVAVDSPVPGRRSRDVRNGLIVPPQLTWRNVRDISRRPRWAFDKLSTHPIEFKMVDAVSELPEQRMAKVFDPRMSVDDLAWVRGQFPGRIVVKGIQSVHDACLVAAEGADAVHLSSHGGRQLEHAPLPFELLPETRGALDSGTQLYVDGGVMSGIDIIACLANGADAVALGRAYLYGLMAAGEAGVRHVVELLRADLRTAMALLGCARVAELASVPVRVRDR